jgi:hypothetical protein
VTEQEKYKRHQEAMRRYRESNREEIRLRYHKNKRKYLDARKLKRKNNPEFAAEENARSQAWHLRNKERVREYHRKKAERYGRTNLNYLIRKRLRNRIGMALSKNSKSGTTLMLLGCSIQDLKIYLESKFDVGMSWQNWGKGKDKWNLDHIIPCALFDLSKPGHQQRCFHFSNYQPLWEIDNIRKGAKSLNGQFNLL